MLLLQKKPISRITITELCRLAGVNRTTFYSHYGSQYDVLREMEQSMTDDIRRILEQKDPARPEELKQQIEALCTYLKEHLALARLLFENNGTESEFATALFRLPGSRALLLQYLPEEYDADDRELLVAFLANGSYSMMRKWVLEEVPKSPQQLTELIYDTIIRAWVDAVEK